MRFTVAAAALLLAACAAPEPASTDPTPTGPAPTGAEPAVRADINAAYLSDDLDVDNLAEGFSDESREVFTARRAVTQALGIEPGDAVADIGAGTGIYLHAFSGAVGPEGRVFAVDISPLLVDYLGRFAAQEGLTNVEARLGGAADTGLASASLDLAFTSNVYHHFERPGAMNAHLFDIVAPGGRLAILDFRKGPDAPDWIERHVRTDMAGVIGEVTSAGFIFTGEMPVSGLEDNYLLVFMHP